MKFHFQNAKKPKGRLLFIDAISSRDYVGAKTILESIKIPHEDDVNSMLWRGYCHFHCGDYEEAQTVYIDLICDKNESSHPIEVNLYLSCMYYKLKMFTEAYETAREAPECALKNRLMLHISSHQRNHSHNNLAELSQQFNNEDVDLVSLAALQYHYGQYQDAISSYKRILLEKKEKLALNVYISMCYYKLDYFDVSLEILSTYMQAYPESIVATNLKACNFYRLYSKKAAAEELQKVVNIQKILESNDLIKHNMAVFLNEEKAVQVFSQLINIVPEARLNLIIYFLKRGKVEEASSLMKKMTPHTSQEYILKAVVDTIEGNLTKDANKKKSAQHYFQKIGENECDTIPGRQCMASFFFLQKEYFDVNTYLDSIKSYMKNDDNFYWNYGLALAATGSYKHAFKMLSSIKNPNYINDFCYTSWISKCYIMNGQPEKAWKLYLKQKESNETVNLLRMIANECYRLGHFIAAGRAFNELEAFGVDKDSRRRKIKACVEVFRKIVISRGESNDTLSCSQKNSLEEVLAILRSSLDSDTSEIVRVMRKYIIQNNNDR